MDKTTSVRIFLIQNGCIGLAPRKTKFDIGSLDGWGGLCPPGYTPIQSAVEYLPIQTGLELPSTRFEQVGIIECRWNGYPLPLCHVFFVKVGVKEEVKEGEHFGLVQWFRPHMLPADLIVPGIVQSLSQLRLDAFQRVKVTCDHDGGFVRLHDWDRAEPVGI